MRITANKINEWANSLDCRGKLSLLIRKLIYENINNLSKCKFPSLEQTTSSSGFDGILESNEETQYVPKGVSVWEMGCGKDERKKANDDYKKRKKDPLNTNPKETAYIQVSPRIWKDEKIKEWCDEKNQDNFWKKVILLDAKDLEEWINNAPAVEQWFAEELGFPNEGVETLGSWWKKWSSVTPNIQFTSTLILTNKEKETKKLKNCLKTSKHIIVKSPTIYESIAFLYSVIDTLPRTEREYYLNKTLIIDNPKSFDFYSQHKDLIIIPTFKFDYNAHIKCFVYIPISNEDPTKENILLNDLRKFDLMNCLINNMKIPEELARKYSNECGGNISILRHILSPKSTNPSWFNENLINVFITLFFVQSWDENNLNDIEIIENISNLTYEEFTRKLMILLNKSNTPLIKNQNIWILKFPQYLFFLIASYITKFDINKQYDTVLKIFKNSNYYDENDKEKYSRKIKKGILKSIIWFDIHKSKLECNTISTYKLIGKIFENEDKLFWIYNTEYISLFAEISPEEFIRNVKKTLNEHEKYIENLFKGLNYTYLLNSLELCSRDPELFNDVVDILIELNKIEYGNELYNSPFNSLKELFIPWVDYNSNFLQIMLNKLDKILFENKKIGWELLKFLLSHESKHSFGISKPIYRDFTTTHKPITRNEIDEFNSEIEEKTIDYLDEDIDKYCFLIDQYRITQNEEYRNKIIEKINMVNYKESEKLILWNKILDTKSKMEHENKKEYDEKIKILEDVSKKFEPKNLIKKFEWAFNNHYIRTSPENDDEDCIRQEIISKIIQEKGFDGIKDLISNIELPNLVGVYVSEYDFDDEVLKLLGTNKKNTEFASFYIRIKSHENFKWVENTFKKIKRENNTYLIEFFISIYPNGKNWKLINDCNPEVINGYWKKCGKFNYKTKKEIEIHVNNLIKYSRYHDAFVAIYFGLKKLETNFIGNKLLEIADEFLENDKTLHECLEILKELYENRYNRKNLMKLECKLFKYGLYKYILYHITDRQYPYPFIIHDEMRKNSKLFSHLINNINNISHYMDILNSFNIIPGTNENNKIDINVLKEWINECKNEINDTELFFVYLARFFAKIPEDMKNWPPEEVCQIIDELNNEFLTQQFSCEIFNKHGYFMSSENGNSRRELSKKYQNYASNIKHEYPITAKALINVSKSFDNHANRIDYRRVNQKYEDI